MGEHDDDERAAAYNRHIYYEFANMVQNYDLTARPQHDDIDFTPATVDELDGIEFAPNGVDVSPVSLLGLLNEVVEAIEKFGSFEEIPDDYQLIADGDDGEDERNPSVTDFIDIEFVYPTVFPEDEPMKFRPKYVYFRFHRPARNPENPAGD